MQDPRSCVPTRQGSVSKAVCPRGSVPDPCQRLAVIYDLRARNLGVCHINMAVYKVRLPADGPEERPRAAPGGSGISDASLCRALAAGQAWAAKLVYDQVDAVLFRIMGPGEGDREDLAQQSLERIISTIVSGRFSHGCSLRSWATIIARHTAIDTMRSRWRERKLFDRTVAPGTLELIAEDGRSPESAAEASRRVEQLVGALSSVNRGRAQAIILHDIMGHDLAEVARLTGLSVAATQSRLVRGRNEVLRFMQDKQQAVMAEGEE
jgi:RNA polymerase sigma factor (sigma-70 family)